MSMMSCKEVVDTTLEYEIAELHWRQRVRLRFHLLICSHCRLFLKQSRICREYLKRHQSELHGFSAHACGHEVERIMQYVRAHDSCSSKDVVQKD